MLFRETYFCHHVYLFQRLYRRWKSEGVSLWQHWVVHKHSWVHPLYQQQTLHKKIKFSVKVSFSKCDQIRRKLRMRIWSHLLKKSLMENFTFCAVRISYRSLCFIILSYDAERLRPDRWSIKVLFRVALWMWSSKPIVKGVSFTVLYVPCLSLSELWRTCLSVSTIFIVNLANIGTNLSNYFLWKLVSVSFLGPTVIHRRNSSSDFGIAKTIAASFELLSLLFYCFLPENLVESNILL